MRTLLVASTGGHLRELHRLQPRLRLDGDDVLWVTNPSAQSDGLLADQHVTHVPYVGSRNARGVAANAARAARILWRFRPDRVISTGSGIALSFLPLARARGVHCAYIESGTRVQGPSLTGRVLQRMPGIACYTQHAGWAGPRWRYVGSVLDGFTPVPRADSELRRVVVTLGTWRQTFRPVIERLLAVLPPNVDVLWQTGHTDVAGLPISARPWLPPDELIEALGKADLIVTHAGMGATLDALEAGRCPLVVPRRAALGEQVDDHQVELAQELERRGLVIARTPEAITAGDLFLAAGREITEQPAPPLDLDLPARPRRPEPVEAAWRAPVTARTALIVASHEGQATVADLIRQARAGERPRKDYVAIAEALNAQVIDSHFLEAHAGRTGRLASRLLGIQAGQVVEVLRRRNSYRVIVSHSVAPGLLLACLCKLARCRVPLVLFAAWLTPRKKAVLLRSFHVDAHIRDFVFYSSVQLEKATMELGVPREKLHHGLQPVDLDYWQARDVTTELLVCAVGWEARDYATLIRAARGLDVEVHLAVGTIVFTGGEVGSDAEGSAGLGQQGTIVRAAGFQHLARTAGHRLYQQWVDEVEAEGWPANVVVHQQLNPTALRDLYARSRFVVVPLFDVDFDAGVNVIAEAMAMGKAVIVTASEGQVDLVRPEHTGLYVPPGDVEALRSAMQRLLDDRALAERLGRNGRAFAEAHLSLDDYVAQVAAIVNRT